MTDSWGEPVATTSSSNPLIKKKAAPVVDDWDNDEDLSSSENSQKIWEDANKAKPMPQIIANNVSSNSSSVPIAAAAVLSQPTMRILKRPTPSKPSSPTPPPVSTPPLADRQARYEAARQRIFAEPTSSTPRQGSSSPSSNALGSRSNESGPAVRVVREPHGPASSPDATTTRGFVGRRPAKPPGKQSS